MAKDIKTKEKIIEKKSKGSVGNAADRAKISILKAKDGVVEAKDKVNENINSDDNRSPEQFATEEVTDGMRTVAEDAVIVTEKAVKKGACKVKEKVKQKKVDKRAQAEAESVNCEEASKKTEQPLGENTDKTNELKSADKKIDGKKQAEKTKPQAYNGKANPTIATPADKQKKPVDEKKKPKQRKQMLPKTRGELSVKKPKSEAQPVKYAHSAESKIKQTARSSAYTKNTIKTADSAIKNAHKSERTAKKSAQATAKAAKKVEKTAKTTAKAVGKAIAEAGKATIAAVKGTETAVAVGGVPAVVVIIIICLLAAVSGTCFGIFLSNDKTTGSKMTMTQVISKLTIDYYTDLEEFKNKYQYDQYEIKTASDNIAIDWKTVLAVYAVKTTTASDGYDVATIDDKKYKLLKAVMNDMNPKSEQVTTKSVPVITVTTDENGLSVKKTTYETKRVLTITIRHLSADEICKQYGFNKEQKAMLNELLGDEYTTLWDKLINDSGTIILPTGSLVGSGKFVWPVAGDYSITSRFGTRVDPITGAVKTHGGTDIAAAQGIPIVAAADGTVVISSYMAGGYGYYVKIQHDGIYSTLYGHCSTLLVSAGQKVKQGQIIAKVGSTGYSTGPHCHFEVIQNGVRVDALSFYD